MEMSLWNLLPFTILLTGLLLLYRWNVTFKFFCKLALSTGWIAVLSTLLTPPFALFVGRNVENTKQILLVAFNLLSSFYCIHMVYPEESQATFLGLLVSRLPLTNLRGTMEMSLWNLLLFTILLTGLLLLYRWNTTFNFFCKMALFGGWLEFTAILLAPPIALFVGRRVENTKVLRFCTWAIKHFYGIKFTVQGSHNLNSKEPCVIVANHQSCVDILGMMEILPDHCVPVVKKEVLYMGPLGFACWTCGFIFIDRKKRKSAMVILEHLARTMQEQKLKIWVFPEGTRNPRGDTMLPFKKGAFHLAVQAQVPIVPVVNVYDGFYSFEERKLNPGCCTIRILPKIETKGLNTEDVAALAENTRKVMQDALDEIYGKTAGEKDASQ